MLALFFAASFVYGVVTDVFRGGEQCSLRAFEKGYLRVDLEGGSGRTSLSYWPLGVRCEWRLADGSTWVDEPGHGLTTLLALIGLSTVGVVAFKHRDATTKRSSTQPVGRGHQS